MFFLKIVIILFIYFWLFRCCAGFSLVSERGGYALLQFVVFSLQWLLLLGNTGSRVGGLNSCSFWVLEGRHNSCDG